MKKLALVSMIVLVALIGSTVASSAQSGIPGTGWYTGEQVQNVGTGSATVAVTAYDKASSATFSASATVAAGAATNFSPASFAGMPSGFQGSAVVSSDQPIKAIVNVTNVKNGSLGVTGGKAAAQYQGMETADTTLYFPLAKNNRFGNTTAFYIQNAGTAAATASVTFKMDNGQSYPFTTASIGPNQMIVVLPSDAGVPNTDANRANIGSMTVTSAQPLAGAVMEFIQAQTVATVLSSTRAFTAADFDTKAYAPVVKKNRFSRFTGIQVQNVTNGPIDVTINYVGSATTCKGVATSDSHTGIAAGASFTFVQNAASGFTDNCTGSATIQGTGNFVAIVNEASTNSAAPVAITYSAMPNSKATHSVSAPLFKDQRYGFSTGLQVQNVGTAEATNIVATFTCKGGGSANTAFTAISKPQTIAAGAAKLFFKPSGTPNDFTSANPFALNGANCGVTISGDQNLVAIANETPDAAGAADDNNYEGFNQ